MKGVRKYIDQFLASLRLKTHFYCELNLVLCLTKIPICLPQHHY